MRVSQQIGWGKERLIYELIQQTERLCQITGKTGNGHVNISRQIGWSNEANLYYEWLKSLSKLGFNGTTTTTSTTSTTSTTTTINPDRLCVIIPGWSTTNLSVTTYRNGDPIPEVTDPTAWINLTTGAWCYYNNDPATEPVYGRLYNWYAVNDPRGLAPVGYHVATDTEWNTLTLCLGGTFVAGAKLKEAGFAHWDSLNTGATNSSGFTALPGGARSIVGAFQGITLGGYWWTANQVDPTSAILKYIFSFNNNVNTANFKKIVGASVRIIQD